MSACPGRLLERVRRNVASDEERTAFEAHQQTCESCRLTMDISRDFELIGAAPDDGARIARLAQHTLGRMAPRARGLARKRWAPLARFALAALVVSGAAAAGLWSWSRSPAPVPPPSVTGSPSPGDGEVMGQRAGSPQGTERAATTEVEPASPVPPEKEQSAAESLPARAGPSKAAVPKANVKKDEQARTASALFKIANAARRQGHSALAISRYQDLQRQFPSSAEATASRVSLGGLLLETGRASQALAQFDRYLAGGGTQRLTAEALYGRGRALRALGRTDQEAKNWRRLLSSYPESPYGGEARRRLSTLDGN